MSSVDQNRLTNRNKTIAKLSDIIVIASLGVTLGPAGIGAFGIVIPSPGGMGSYHYLVISALAIYGISKFDGFSFANIVFFS